eukprot:m.651484 g.651484  ORF g.651484 m.651484 type:complete len:510 (+) comp22676_c2_seq1:196-1725(+)
MSARPAKRIRPAVPCRCGSTTHARVSSKLCPMNTVEQERLKNEKQVMPRAIRSVLHPDRDQLLRAFDFETSQIFRAALAFKKKYSYFYYRYNYPLSGLSINELNARVIRLWSPRLQGRLLAYKQVLTTLRKRYGIPFEITNAIWQLLLRHERGSKRRPLRTTDGNFSLDVTENGVLRLAGAKTLPVTTDDCYQRDLCRKILPFEINRSASRTRFSQYLRTDEVDTSKPHSMIFSVGTSAMDCPRGKVLYFMVPSNASLREFVNFVQQVLFPHRESQLDADITVTRHSCAKKFTDVFDKYDKRSMIAPAWYGYNIRSHAAVLQQAIKQLHIARDNDKDPLLRSARAQEMLNEVYVLPFAVIVFNIQADGADIVRVEDNVDGSSIYKKQRLGGIDAVVKEARIKLPVLRVSTKFCVEIQLKNFDCSIEDIIPSMEECNEPAESAWDKKLPNSRFGNNSKSDPQVDLHVSFPSSVFAIKFAIRKVGVWRRVPDARYPLQLDKNDIGMYAHVW